MLTGQRIVVPQNLQKLAVAGAAAVRHSDSIEGQVLAPPTREANACHPHPSGPPLLCLFLLP